MKFIIDAQLPQSLAIFLNDRGFDAMHTLQLPEANNTDDQQISTLADQQDRVVITKDDDFFNDHILRGKPRRLLIVKTGNIKNAQLLQLFAQNMSHIQNLFRDHVLIEMNQKDLIVHR